MNYDGKTNRLETVWRSHCHFGGNALVGEAFWILSETVPHEKLKNYFLVSHTLRVQGVNGGQARDILLENRQNTPEDTEKRIVKTGALIRCSALLGGILANASQEQEQYLLQYTDSLGLAFQIRDDILDAEETPKHSEKATGKMSLQRICSNIWIGTSERKTSKR